MDGITYTTKENGNNTIFSITGSTGSINTTWATVSTGFYNSKTILIAKHLQDVAVDSVGNITYGTELDSFTRSDNADFAKSILDSLSLTNLTGTLDPENGVVDLTSVAGGTGTVTSVGLTVPSPFSVSGSPITDAGTLAVGYTATKGDLLYASNTNTLASLPIGTAGQVLAVSGGGIPAWQAAAGTPFINASPSTPSVSPTVGTANFHLAIGDNALVSNYGTGVGVTDNTTAINNAKATGYGAIAINTGTASTTFYKSPAYVPGAKGGADNTSPGGGPSIAIGWGSYADAEGAIAIAGWAFTRSMALIHGVANGEFASAIGDGSVASSNFSHSWYSNAMPVNSNGNTLALMSPGPSSSVRGRTTGVAGGTAGLAISSGGVTISSALHGNAISAPGADVSSDYGTALSGLGLDVRGYAQVAIGQYNTPRTSTSLTAFDSAGAAFLIGNGTSSGATGNAFEFYFDKRLFAGSTQVTDTSGKVLAAALNTVGVPQGGNGLTTAALGDLRYGSGTNTLAALSGNTTTTKKFLNQTGDGVNSAAPAWGTIAVGDLPTVDVARGGTNITSYTAGDLLYATGSTTLAKLGVGSNGTVLKVVSGAPAWAASSAGSAYFVDPGSAPTTTPTVTSSTDGLAIGSGAVTTTGARAIAVGNSYASGADSWAVQNNDHTGTYGAQGANAVAIGKNNLASGARSAVFGGDTNSTSRADTYIYGGNTNVITGTANSYAAIVAGQNNTINSSGAQWNGIFAGQFNTYGGGGWGALIAGFGNSSNTSFSVIAGGEGNTLTTSSQGDHCFIGAGQANKADGKYASTIGGTGLNATGYNQLAIGQHNTRTPATLSTTYTSTDPAFIIGNGTGTGARSNAFELTFDGKLKIQQVGGGLQIKEGTNATMGKSTLVGGTVTVSTTAVSANSRIFLTAQTNAGTPGFLGVTARSAGTSFTITSSSASDTSDVAWLIVEPN